MLKPPQVENAYGLVQYMINSGFVLLAVGLSYRLAKYYLKDVQVKISNVLKKMLGWEKRLESSIQKMDTKADTLKNYADESMKAVMKLQAETRKELYEIKTEVVDAVGKMKILIKENSVLNQNIMEHETVLKYHEGKLSGIENKADINAKGHKILKEVLKTHNEVIKTLQAKCGLEKKKP